MCKRVLDIKHLVLLGASSASANRRQRRPDVLWSIKILATQSFHLIGAHSEQYEKALVLDFFVKFYVYYVSIFKT